MNSQKNVLTTGDVARICNVAPRTVSKWFDSGQLRGYRIPGSKDRRIPVDQLKKFMRANGMPLNEIEDGRQRILIVDGDEEFATNLKDVLVRAGGFEVAIAGTALEAGAGAAEIKPQFMLVDVDMVGVTANLLSRFVRRLPHADALFLIATGRGLSEGRGQGLLQEGFHALLPKPFDVRSLVRLMDQHAVGPTSESALN